ncbi:hypothetical protein N8911_01875, partial [bacterium]|nr:hypothetical protein [bacterium]
TKMSIGVLSFSLKGMNHLDFHTDLLQPFNLGYRTGSRLFYNILQIGYGSYVGLGLLSYGYGIGTEIGPQEKRVHINLETMARQVLDLNNKQSPLNLNVRFDPTLNIRLGDKRPAIVLGPSLNLMVSDGVLQNQNSENGKTMGFRDSFPPVYGDVNSTVEVHFWVGAKLGIRI